MASSTVRRLSPVAVSLCTAALLFVGCTSVPELDETSAGQEQPLVACSFTVTKNVYVGADWWGTITFKNNTTTSIAGVQVAFDVPSGVSCDYAPTGWSYTQTSRTCTYRASKAIAAGASMTLNYSTTSQAFSAATNVKVTATGCGSTSPVTADAGSTTTPDSGSATDSGIKPGATWRKANLTNFTSYPDPNSEECIAYNGCTWAGQFAALPNKMPESWVAANNIAAVHSKDFAAYKLKTLRLRQGTKQIDVKVYDMCADTDCSGCCTANSRETGFLIDVESYTAERFGTGDGLVEWTCLDCP